MPRAEDYYETKYHFQGFIPDFPEPRTWGCCKCDAAFWKDTKHNLAALGGLTPRQWPKQDKKYVEPCFTCCKATWQIHLS